MKRFKTLLGAKLLIFALFVLMTSSVNQSVALAEPQESIASVRPGKTPMDLNQLRLYKEHRQELEAALEAYFEKAIASGDIIGAGVSIVRGDSIVISGGYGKRNIDFSDRVDGETVFRLGSLSKGFGGILAVSLTQEGKLKWDDRVSDFIPGFRLGDRKNTDKITLAHILSHTSGAPYHSFTNLVEAGLPLKDIAQRFGEVAPISEPGSLYSYQNALFALSGEMIRKVTGQELAKSLQKRFFKPLGMDAVSMDYKTLSHSENVAMPHSRRRNGWKSVQLSDSYDNAILAGGINASAFDMAKWMRFLLGHNPEVLNRAAIEEAFNPVVEIKGGNKYYYRWPGHLSSYYGFGWRIHKFMENGIKEEKTIWHHGGSVNNYRNEIAIYPEEDLGICVLFNGNFKLAKRVIPDLHRIVKDIYGGSPSQIAFEESWKKDKKPTFKLSANTP